VRALYAMANGLYLHLEMTPDETFHATSGVEYRLAEAGMNRDGLLRDSVERGRSRRRYKRAAAWVTISAAVVAFLGAACSVASIACAAPFPADTLPLSAIALGLGLLTGMAGVVTRILVRKAAKHSHLELLAANRGNAVAALVSAGLEDGAISEAEFKLILAERSRYADAVAQIRARDRHENVRPPVDTDSLKKELLSQARRELVAEITTKATA
jgi:hypothetical protein